MEELRAIHAEVIDQAQQQGPRSVPCSSCGKPMVWVKTVNGKAMPIDAEPVADGNLVLAGDGTVRVLKKGEKGPVGAGVPGPYYKSHFATCSHPQHHRKHA